MRITHDIDRSIFANQVVHAPQQAVANGLSNQMAARRRRRVRRFSQAVAGALG